MANLIVHNKNAALKILEIVYFQALHIIEIAKAISMINSSKHDVYANAIDFLMNFNTSVNFVFTKLWILDSGTTYHIISNS